MSTFAKRVIDEYGLDRADRLDMETVERILDKYKNSVRTAELAVNIIFVDGSVLSLGESVAIRSRR